MEHSYLKRKNKLTFNNNNDNRCDELIKIAVSEKDELAGKKCNIKAIFVIAVVSGLDDPEYKPWNMRRAVFIPIAAMQRSISGFDPDPGLLQILLRNHKSFDQMLSGIISFLPSRHRGVYDFETSTAEWIDQTRNMISNVALLMAVVSAISLLVGGLNNECDTVKYFRKNSRTLCT